MYMLTHSALAGVRKHYALALLLAMLATAIFDHLFIKSNISAMDRLVDVKFHTNVANDTKKNNGYHSQLTCLGGAFFPVTLNIHRDRQRVF